MKNFIALLLFCTAFGGWYLYQKHDSAQKELVEISKSSSAYEQTLTARRSELQAFVKVLELQKKIQSTQADILGIKEKDGKIKDDISKLVTERARIVSKTRQSMIGMILPELTLTDGRKLAQVKILKADDSGLSVSLPVGVLKILPSELPDDMQQRLHYSK